MDEPIAPLGHGDYLFQGLTKAEFYAGCALMGLLSMRTSNREYTIGILVEEAHRIGQSMAEKK